MDHQRTTGGTLVVRMAGGIYYRGRVASTWQAAFIRLALAESSQPELKAKARLRHQGLRQGLGVANHWQPTRRNYFCRVGLCSSSEKGVTGNLCSFWAPDWGSLKPSALLMWDGVQFPQANSTEGRT